MFKIMILQGEEWQPLRSFNIPVKADSREGFLMKLYSKRGCLKTGEQATELMKLLKSSDTYFSKMTMRVE